MDVKDAVAGYVQGQIARADFVAALVSSGESAEGAAAYAQVLDVQGRSRETAVGNIYPAVDPDRHGPLADEDVAVLTAMAARIMPTTSTPGATEASAVSYILGALSGAYADLMARYRRGLHALEQYCVAEMGAPFARLGEDRQDAVLADLAAGKLADVGADGDFFQLVRAHVMEGMFCEPAYGGNRDMIGWRLVGFPGQRYGYPDAYINRVVDLEPIAQDGPPRKET
jgi:gluconate 2-dehydrogenase gamma chain